MGFIQPNLPVVDAAWSKGTRAERIVPMARHIAANGFGTPLIMHVMYARQDRAVHPRRLAVCVIHERY